MNQAHALVIDQLDDEYPRYYPLGQSMVAPSAQGPIRATAVPDAGVTDTEVGMFATGSTFEDCLPLTRLYAQFDAIAEGVVHGDSTAAHRAVLYRLASNQRTAEGPSAGLRAGWSDRQQRATTPAWRSLGRSRSRDRPRLDPPATRGDRTRVDRARTAIA